MESNELLTICEMGQKLTVPMSWLYSRTRIKGVDTIPHVRIGKCIRFNKAEVMDWIQENYSGDSHGTGED